MDIFAEIIVDNKSTNTDILYTYKIPNNLRNKVKKGSRVLVPFGIGNKLLQGIIINIVQEIEINKNKVKNIDSTIDEEPILSEEMVDLGLWMKRKYITKYIKVFKTLMPTGITKKLKRYINLIDGSLETSKIKSKNQIEIINYLKDNNNVEIERLKRDININNIMSSIKSLEKKEIIEVNNKLEQEVNKKIEKYVVKKFDNNNFDKIVNQLNSRAYKQKEIINYLKNIDVIKLSELINKLDCSHGTIKSLSDKGLVDIIEKEVMREVLKDKSLKSKNKKLSLHQKKCFDTILKSIYNEEYERYLIHGVTGSGKTEVYLQLINEAIKKNKQAIVLIPEISLTPQTVRRFVDRFGNRIAVLHSKLSLGERFDQWRKIKNGEVDIAIGARSAVFAPFKNLGIIIIDEEHETSYKSNMDPKYDTIEVAEKRCELEDSVLVLGSATPSIRSYYLAKKDVYKLLDMPYRINNKAMPHVEVIDMRDELESGNKSIFSKILYKEIKDNLDKKKQSILFINRRGYSTFISCRKCGYVEKCPNCDISLTFHKHDKWLKCHYCGYAKKPPNICPDCGSKYIKYFGVGTQKVEDEVRRTFEDIKVSRMDVDTTSKKNSHEKILNEFRNNNIDILVGTQMISKGLDFPNVTLVGVIAADLTLNLPDYKASERTFQLITQVAGRSGRGEDEGKVIIQTYEPEHYSIVYSKDHDYVSFYEEEIKLRRAFTFPPFINLVSITTSGKNLNDLERITKRVSNVIIKNIMHNDKKFDKKNNYIGPSPAPIPKVNNKFRWQIIIKVCDKNLDMIKNIIEWVCIKNNYNIDFKDVKVSIDINPNSII